MRQTARQSASPRCAYCHDDLHAAPAETCVACGTQLHSECSLSLATCPSLGCEGPWTRLQTVGSRLCNLLSWLPTLLLSALLGAIVLFLLVMGLYGIARRILETLF